MDLMTTLLLLGGTAALAVAYLGWEISGRWAYMTSRSLRRLQDADAPEWLDEQLEYGDETAPLWTGTGLKRRLREANLALSPAQFSLLVLGLALGGGLLAWAFFIPGLPALAAAGILGYLPLAYLQERIRQRGRSIDERLAIALSRIAPGLHTNRGLSQVLSEVAYSLQAEGDNPLSQELLRTSKDLRTRDAGEALRDLARRSPSLSLANVAMLLESYQRAGGGQYAEVISETAVAIQRIIAVRSHAQAKATQPLQSARLIPGILGLVLLVMLSDPLTRASFGRPLIQMALALAMGVMLLGYLYMRSEVLKAV